jgi:hypothetical protein
MPNLDGALCLTDKNCHFWLSFVESEIEYAKSKCPECPAIMECAGIILEVPDVVGVLAGTSEFDRMELTWKEVDGVEGTNWEGLGRFVSENLR